MHRHEIQDCLIWAVLDVAVSDVVQFRFIVLYLPQVSSRLNHLYQTDRTARTTLFDRLPMSFLDGNASLMRQHYAPNWRQAALGRAS